MHLYTNGGNIRSGNCWRFTSLTMYNLHIFYLTPLMFPSMHDYCFLPCMWPQVIDLFSSKQAGIAGMAVSFSIAQVIAWPEGSRLAWSLSIVSFHAWLLFPSIHVASDDRFVSFKAGGDRRDGSFFFYRESYHMTGREERSQKKVTPKNSLTFRAEVYANGSS